MAVTILEALENAHFNLCTQIIPGISDKIGSGQLRNSITLLEKGYSPHTEVEPLLDKYGSAERVPPASNPDPQEIKDLEKTVNEQDKQILSLRGEVEELTEQIERLKNQE